MTKCRYCGLEQDQGQQHYPTFCISLLQDKLKIAEQERQELLTAGRKLINRSQPSQFFSGITVITNDTFREFEALIASKEANS